MNPNVQVNNLNRLIGDVIGNYHALGTEQKFEVDNVYSTFISMKKTTPDPNHKAMVYGKGGQGVPAPPSSAPPMNVVYGGAQGGPPMGNVAFGGGGSQMNMQAQMA